MTQPTRWRGAALATGVFIVATPLLAQSGPEVGPTVRSQREAQEIVAKAVRALGGPDALAQMRRAHLELTSRLFTEGQGLHPDSGLTAGQPGRVTVDYDGPRAVYRTFNGESLNFRYVTGGAEPAWVYFSAGNAVSPVEKAAAVGFLERATVSPVYVSELLQRAAALRNLGRASLGYQQYDAVAYADDTGRQVTFYFDDAGLPVRLESIIEHAQYGDQTIAVEFSDYRRVGILQIPHRVVRRAGEVVQAETTVESLTFGETIDPTLLTRPDSATDGQPIQAPVTTPRALEVEDLGEGIHLIRNAAPNYNVIFVAQTDGIIVLETPQTPQASRDVIWAINGRYPNRRIRAAVPTHFHFDHSGGVSGYTAEGMAIITTAGNRPFVERVAAAPRRVGVARSSPARRPSVEIVERRRAFGQGAQRVELIDVGPNPHVEEILVAYLPAIRTLFVGDLFNTPPNGQIPPANADLLAFAERLESLGLEFERVIPVHGDAATAEQFWDAVRRGREQAQQ